MDSKRRQDLKALLTILRANGVMEFKMEGLELKLCPDAMKVKAVVTEDADIAAVPKDGKWSDFPAGTLTPEQLMYYSTGGLPENDPSREDDS